MFSGQKDVIRSQHILPENKIGAAIRDVQLGTVTARVQYMHTHAGADEADLRETVAVDQKKAQTANFQAFNKLK